eukprot:2463488-Pleurochrysis_carterae.AAC.2
MHVYARVRPIPVIVRVRACVNACMRVCDPRAQATGRVHSQIERDQARGRQAGWRAYEQVGGHMSKSAGI